jgi:hypothetical protein
MGFDHIGSQGRAGELIARWGKPAKLLRIEGGQLRDCIAAKLEFSPRERGLIMEGAERVLIAANGLTIAPDHQLDMFINLITSKQYRIVQPVKGPRPGDVAIFYDLSIVYDAPYP